MDAVKEAVLEQKIDHLGDRFEQVDARFDQVDARFRQVDARFEQVDARFERLETAFERAEERNREEHLEIRAEFREEIGGLRAEMNEGFRLISTRMDNLDANLSSFQRSVITILGSFLAAIVASVVAVVVAQLF